MDFPEDYKATKDLVFGMQRACQVACENLCEISPWSIELIHDIALQKNI